MGQTFLFVKYYKICCNYTGFPLELENLEKWKGIFQSEKKSGNFEQTGKVRENHRKYWKNQENSEKCYLLF